MSSIERRELLRFLAGGTAVGTAGCAGLTGESSEQSATAQSTQTSDSRTSTDGSRTAPEETPRGDTIRLPSAVTSGDLPDGDIPLREEGTVTLLNFFTTWCGPCREEMPALRQLRSEYDESEFRLVSITPQVERAMIESFWEEFDATWPVVTDTSLRATEKWNANSYPTNLLFDSDGDPAGDRGPKISARTFDGFDELVSPLVSEG
jgi:thiol-disulfide isomerase/thioredoxin